MTPGQRTRDRAGPGTLYRSWSPPTGNEAAIRSARVDGAGGGARGSAPSPSPAWADPDLGYPVAPPARHPAETTGSLTGHILAQGWPDVPTTANNTAKVIGVLLVGLGILIVLGVLVVLGAGDIFGSLFAGMLNG